MSNQPRYLNDRDPWMLAEDIPEIDFQFSQIWLSSFVNDLEKVCGKNYKKILSVYRGYSLKFYYGEHDSDAFGRHLLKLLITKPGFGKLLNSKIRIYSDKFKQFCRKITQGRLKSFSNRELAKFYMDLDKLHTKLYSYGWLPNAVDMFHTNFTNYLKALLKKRLPEGRVNPALVALSVFPEKSIINIEHESFLKLVALKQAGAASRLLRKAINTHLQRFFYLKHLWLGKEGVYTYGYYLKEINHFIKSKEGAAELLNKENKIFKQTLAERTRLVKDLKLDKKQKELFDVYAEFAVTKAYRRDAQLYWAYKMDFIFKELSQRLKISFMQSRFMSPAEIVKALRRGIDKNLKKEITKRTKYCAYYAEKGIDRIYYGKEAEKLEAATFRENVAVEELEGQSACLGKARGTVKVVNTVADMKKMKQGEILVSIATNPDIVPAMKKAAAIVTEQGGITSHAAIVSREMGIPCVIGTKIATKVFKDGDLVEVDANKGIVKKL